MVKYPVFTVEIIKGNSDMVNNTQIATALRKVADEMEYQGKTSGRIADINGNSVGSYRTVNKEV